MAKLHYDILENDGETVRAGARLEGRAAAFAIMGLQACTCDRLEVGTRVAGVIVTAIVHQFGAWES
jgi:hypothetical protein